ncbi:hypothetical protein [Streptomyces yaizuensis]|uniref:Uncharacterized protein n=1 Tax=Streptomyces yaizuensis TaxID=2989713 RepID=A0ABQ5NVL9_9ACTN|nr:hypothetical protein [Streptomyces sp. YSPA8]GLF94405.1 hypothetical protein SYYSPA8_08930 [Streptomyces sp. YSPA8]
MSNVERNRCLIRCGPPPPTLIERIRREAWSVESFWARHVTQRELHRRLDRLRALHAARTPPEWKTPAVNPRRQALEGSPMITPDDVRAWRGGPPSASCAVCLILRAGLRDAAKAGAYERCAGIGDLLDFHEATAHETAVALESRPRERVTGPVGGEGRVRRTDAKVQESKDRVLAERGAVTKRYLGGEPVSALATGYRVTEAWLRSALKDWSVPMRRRGASHRGALTHGVQGDLHRQGRQEETRRSDGSP